MRVVIVSPSLDAGGPTNVIYNMLEAYVKGHYKFEISLICLSDARSNSRQSDFEKLGIKVMNLYIPKGYKGIFYASRLKKAILCESPNIVHVHGFVPEMLLSMINLPNVKKITSQFNFPFEDYVMLYGKILGKLMSQVSMLMYRHFDMVIPCSQYIINRIKDVKKDVPYKYRVIYTGVPTDKFSPLDREGKIAARKRLGLPIDKKIFLYIAVFIKRKNPKILVRAFSELKQEDCLLLMMGDGELVNGCKQICDDPNVVKYLGKQNSTLEYLQVSDYLVSASYSEGFPTAVLEAMSVGVAPILSAIGPHIEMLSGVSTPMLFNADDKETLKSIISQPDSSIDYREYFYHNFSSTVMIEKHYELYKELLNIDNNSFK